MGHVDTAVFTSRERWGRRLLVLAGACQLLAAGSSALNGDYFLAALFTLAPVLYLPAMWFTLRTRVRDRIAKECSDG